MIITENQKKEIEHLIPGHEEALVAFGADMYRRGLVTGAVWLALGIGCGFILKGSRMIYRNRSFKKKNEEES